MSKTFTKKQLAARFEIGDTTVRDTLRACGFDTKLQEYPADEIEQIFAPAREMFKNGKLKDLEQVEEWAARERERLGLAGARQPKQSSHNATPSGDQKMMDRAWKQYRDVIRHHLRANPTRFFELAMTEMVDFISSDESEDGWALWADEHLLQSVQKEMRSVPPRHRQGLPFNEDDVIDTTAEELDDDGEEEDFTP